MHKSMMTLLMISLVALAGCNTFRAKVVCKELRSAEIELLPLYDISIKYNRCRARCFDFNQWAVAPLNMCPDLVTKAITDKDAQFDNAEDSINFPLERCNDVAGFTLKDMAREVQVKILKLNDIKDQFCP